ncbi:pre-rRNA processing and 40S ribosomal subunit assembly [Sporothrix epigloea]|uniref:Pre-rRNA processing and 40S ribosomal subunit assembly n=1 Tax=Sporothrix epigloea TaxID=1892477 RepID=A0ABP0D9B9_9PEZI
MATVLGKRKNASADATSDSDTIQDIFRRHFEAQFKPLTVEIKDNKSTDRKRRAKEVGTSRKQARKGAPVVIIENESDDDGDDDDDADQDGEDSDTDDDSIDSDGSEDGWSGLSGDEDEDEDGDKDRPKNATPAIEIVDYSTDATRETPETAMSKQERKLYLSKRPPTSFDEEASRAAKNSQSKSKKKSDATVADGTLFKDAPELLANDLELQRLISESHLLAGAFRLPSSFSTASGATSTLGSVSSTGSASAGGRHNNSSQPFAAGRLRQRTADLRIQAAANKARGDALSSAAGTTVTVSQASESIFTQAKMPMSMRKGIAAAAASRESRRRKEARESGIVLERPAAKAVSKSAAKRMRAGMRAVDAPAVGKMRGSELRLRDKDVREIEGAKKGAMNKKKKRRR